MAPVQETKRFENNTTNTAVEHQNGLRAGFEVPTAHPDGKKSKLDWKLRAAAALGGITAIASGVLPALNADNGRDLKDNDEPQRSPVTRSIDNMNSGGWFSPKIKVAEAAGNGDNGNGRGGPNSDPTPVPDKPDTEPSNHPSGNDRNNEPGNSYPQVDEILQQIRAGKEVRLEPVVSEQTVVMADDQPSNNRNYLLAGLSSLTLAASGAAVWLARNRRIAKK